MSKRPISTHVVRDRLSRRERRRIVWFAEWRRRHERTDSAVPALWLDAQRRPGVVPRRIRDALLKVGSHTGPAALIVQNAIKIPWRYWHDRTNMIDAFSATHWSNTQYDWLVRRTMRQVMVMMASVGYHIIVESYQEQPNYIFHAKAKEDCGQHQQGYPHKLPDSPATMSPNRPFGPALFGRRRSQFEGAFAPDIVVFIMLERRPPDFWTRNIELGPHLYFLEDILKELQSAEIRALYEPKFTITPDTLMGTCPQEEGDDPLCNPFGAAIGVSLFGTEGKDARKYMRFTFEGNRMTGANPSVNDRRQYIDALRNATARLRNATPSSAPRYTLDRGDILFVNNRRVATHWDENCRHKRLLAGQTEPAVKTGDRLVFQMNFYSASEVVA